MPARSVVFPANWRIPALCLLVSVALHWLALGAWFRGPTGLQLAGPATHLRIAMPRTGASVDAQPVTPTTATPGPASASDADPRGPAAADVGLGGTRAGSVEGLAPSRREADAVAPSARERPAAAAPPVATHPLVPARPVVPAAPVASPEHAAAPPPAAANRADDRGIRTPEQYRLALMFEARRLSVHGTHGRTGRVRLRLAFAAGGLPQSTQLIASSGDPEVDVAAAELIGRAQAATPVPTALWQRAFDVDVTVSFESR